MVFDIKMEDFQRKTCLVAGGHKTHMLEIITYSRVATRESVCITLAMVVLHDLEVKAADVLNTYIMVLNHEKILTVLGPEFGDNAGKSAIRVKLIFIHESAGASFRAHLAKWVLLMQCRPQPVDEG